VSEASPPVSPLEAYRAALLGAAESRPSLNLVEPGLVGPLLSSAFAGTYPTRYAGPTLPDPVRVVGERSAGGAPVFLAGPLALLTEGIFPSLARSLILPRRNVKLIAFPPADAGAEDGSRPAVVDDLALMRSLPGVAVVVPADGPTVRAAVTVLAEGDGAAYLRLPGPTAPPTTRGAFALGRASELRSGADLTIAALGAMVGPALAVADELGTVGISVRVLDLASVRPLDEGAILRAARETGAILVAETGPIAGGVGPLVAALTSENRPVPVRRLGAPDLGVAGAGLTLERLRDEAFELLRLRGKIT
jgi:transketolase